MDNNKEITPGIVQGRKFRSWRLALCQHPMFLLIKEDTLCAERSAYWGGDYDHHIDRLERNLNALSDHPEMKINWDLAACELELINETRPDLIKRMREFASDERIAFVNGSWSQPHFQVLGSESLLKQFEYGREAIERLTGYNVKCWASQEAGTAEQLPQVLSSMGYHTATVSHFAWGMQFETPHPTLGYRGRLHFLDSEPFTNWKSLDGASIPLYLADVGGTLHGFIGDEGVYWEYMKGALKAPTIRVGYPDMIDVDAKWLEGQLRNGKFVLIDKELEEELKLKPPKSSVRVMPLYTYAAEGIQCSSLNIWNRRVESRMNQLRAVELINANLIKTKPTDLTDEWREIVTCQHHDAYWPGGPELREKFIERLKKLERKLSGAINQRLFELGKQVDTPIGGSVIVVNTIPKPLNSVVKIQVPTNESAYIADVTYNGEKYPVQVISESDQNDTVLIPVSFEGLGYEIFEIERKPQAEAHQFEILREPLTFQNKYYRAIINPDLSFSYLDSRAMGQNLTTGEANVITAMRPDGTVITTKNSQRSTRVEKGPVATVVTATYEYKEMDLKLSVYFYDSLPWIECVANFDFKDAEFGDYWTDETKLKVEIPLSYNPKVRYDVPFGNVEGIPDSCYVALSWLDTKGDSGGLAFFNEGTPKHFFSGNTLMNVLGWGGDTDKFNSRCYGEFNYHKKMDLRLKGKHTCRWGIMPHDGATLDSGVPLAAKIFNEPLVGALPIIGTGSLSISHQCISIRNRNLLPVSVETTAEGYKMMLYEDGEKNIEPSIRSEIGQWRLNDLSGKRIDTINRFQIVTVDFDRH